MWLAYVGVTLLGALVGVAIAGVPSGGNDGVSQISSAADTAPVVETSQPDVEVAATTTTVTVPPTTTAETTTTTTVAPTTSTTNVITTTSSTTTTVPLPERGDMVVVAVNGANVAGLAGRTTDLLVGLGYTQNRSTDGTIIAETTVIYFADDRIAEAERLAADIGLDDPLLRPVDDNVPFNVLEGDELVVYVGLDRA
jgi:hypothetical protein